MTDRNAVTVALKPRTVTAEMSPRTVHVIVPADVLGAPEPGPESSEREGA